MLSTERIIQILASVNATAIDNDGGKPGEYLAKVCHEAAERLRVALMLAEVTGITAASGGDPYFARPARAEQIGGDET